MPGAESGLEAPGEAVKVRRACTLEVEEAINHKANVGHFAPPGEHVDCGAFYRANGGRNVALTAGAGVMLFCPLEDDEYEVHFAFTPPIRGPHALSVARTMLDHVFTHYGPNAIVGLPPRDNRAVRTVGYLLGFRPTGKVTTDSLGRECIEYRLEREQWVT